MYWLRFVLFHLFLAAATEFQVFVSKLVTLGNIGGRTHSLAFIVPMINAVWDVHIPFGTFKPVSFFVVIG